MMTSTLKWMALGAVLGFSVATGVSCGPAKCTARNCAFGCCDATGVCQTGNSDSQCGQAGAVCAQCVLGQSCSFGRCGLNGAGGSSGGGTGGSSGGGGGGGTGGGTTDALCTRLNSASISFFAGRTVCTDGMSTISQGTSGLARCNAGITQCAAADRTSLATYSGCLETGRVCTPGNEGSAISNFTSCVTTLSSNISQPCSAALFSSSSGGGGGGTPVGGGAGGGTPQGGGTGAGGGGIGGGTGAGPSGGGGGGASNCATLGATYSSFMAGRSICTNGTASVNADPTIASRCASGCFTTNDQAGVQSFSTCLTGTTCFTGNETTALSTFQNCAASILSGLSSPCQAALSTGAAGGGTGGGGGVGTTLLNITISGALDSTTNYTFTVPSGTTSLTITTQGGTGDVDLFLSRLTIPTVAVNDSSSQNTGNAETLFLPSPTAGVWHLMALGYAAYAGVTLTIIAQ